MRVLFILALFDQQIVGLADEGNQTIIKTIDELPSDQQPEKPLGQPLEQPLDLSLAQPLDKPFDPPGANDTVENIPPVKDTQVTELIQDSPIDDSDEDVPLLMEGFDIGEDVQVVDDQPSTETIDSPETFDLNRQSMAPLFVTLIFVVIVAVTVFNNRRKIIGYIVEGSRNSAQKRRNYQYSRLNA